MKKITLILAASVLAVSMLAGCSQDSGPAAAGTAAAEENKAADGVSKEAASENLLQKAADGSFIKPENYGTVKKLGNYKGLEYTLGDTTVTDEEVQAQIDALLQSAATFEPVNRAAGDGDMVNIDYVGKIDGTPYAGGSDENFDLELGSLTFLEDFEKGLIGAKKGETRDISVKFPEGYDADALSGKDAVFTVTVNEVKEKRVPDFTDEWAGESTSGAYTNTEDFRKEIRRELEEVRRQEAVAAVQNKLVSDIINASEFELTGEAVEYEYQQLIGLYKGYADAMGLSVEDYFGMCGLDPDEVKQGLRRYAEEAVKQRLVEDAIIEAEGIEITAEDEKAVADGYGYDADEVKQTYGEEEFMTSVKARKIIDYIYDNAVEK